MAVICKARQQHKAPAGSSSSCPHRGGLAIMVLGESYLKGILRPPLADVKALPPNPPHPFQTDMGFYLRQRFLKHHFPLVVGFAVAIYAFSGADSAMRDAKKRAYDEAVAAGRQPCECR